MNDVMTWKCEVCGYIHEGPEPPETCPICGVGPEMFTPMDVIKTAAPEPAASAWRCSVCGYIHEGPEPPERCPICSVGAELFDPVFEPTGAATAESGETKIVIVGAGIAGTTAAEHARKTAPDAVITIVSNEPGLPYYRLNLTRFLAGEVTERDLNLKAASWLEDTRVDLLEGEVAEINRSERTVRLRAGLDLSYETLVLANGSHPFIPPIMGATRNGVMPFRTIADALEIGERVADGTPVVVIGGGLLGLETAGALMKKGANVTVVEGFEWLLPRQLPRPAGALLQDHLEKLGLSIICGAKVKEIAGDETVRAVTLGDGTELPADLVVMATGVRSNSYLARQCGLTVQSGVVVDDRMASSDPGVFAAGDVAEHRGVVFGIWPTSYAQGAVAGVNAAGGNAEFTGMPRSNSLKVIDTDVFSIGDIEPTDGSFHVIEEHGEGTYRRLIVRDGYLRGAVLYGDTAIAAVVKDAIEKKTQILQNTELIEAVPALRAHS